MVEGRWRCGERERQGRVRRAGGDRERRRLQDRASLFESGQSGDFGGSWGACAAPPGTGGGEGGSPPPSLDPPRRDAAAAAAGGKGRVTVPGGVGPGGPIRRARGGRGDTVPGRGGWPLVVGGVWGWSARWLPSHTLVLLLHGGLWPGGVAWSAVIVVGMVLVVVVVGPLVVVALVVVGMVLLVWP